jgi:predicted RNA-binding Zn-ribbon protein involved in translation (DUF1610 family)
MGCEDERDWFAALDDRRTRRQGNRPERYALHYPWWRLREGIREAQGEGVSASLAICPAGKQAKAKKASKTKFTCPECGQNASAKPDALLICGACYEEGEGYISLMLAELGEDAEVT